LPYGLPQPLALVCYEAIFPGAFLDRALASEWIVNVTNDAWFGATAGPHQHFHIARARAIETGLPLVRVANTGLSGVVDPYGRILVISELNQVAVLDLPLPRNTGSLYAGLPLPANWGFLSIIVILLIVFMLCRRRPTTA
jgi:apolipoprotein N-acyltransferase